MLPETDSEWKPAMRWLYSHWGRVCWWWSWANGWVTEEEFIVYPCFVTLCLHIGVTLYYKLTILSYTNSKCYWCNCMYFRLNTKIITCIVSYFRRLQAGTRPCQTKTWRKRRSWRRNWRKMGKVLWLWLRRLSDGVQLVLAQPCHFPQIYQANIVHLPAVCIQLHSPPLPSSGEVEHPKDTVVLNISDYSMLNGLWNI